MASSTLLRLGGSKGVIHLVTGRKQKRKKRPGPEVIIKASRPSQLHNHTQPKSSTGSHFILKCWKTSSFNLSPSQEPWGHSKPKQPQVWLCPNRLLPPQTEVESLGPGTGQNASSDHKVNYENVTGHQVQRTETEGSPWAPACLLTVWSLGR